MLIQQIGSDIGQGMSGDDWEFVPVRRFLWYHAFEINGSAVMNSFHLKSVGPEKHVGETTNSAESKTQ